MSNDANAPATPPASRLRAALADGRAHALGALLVRLAAAGLAYLLQVVLARALGAGDYGLFNITWNILTIGGFLATFGFSELAVRFLAQYHERGDYALASGFLRIGASVTLAGAVLAALAGLMLAPTLGAAYGPLAMELLRLGLIALPFFALTDYLEGVARSQGWTVLALAPPYVLRQGLVILIVVGLLLFHPPVTPAQAMLATALASALAAVAHVALLRRRLGETLPDAAPRYDLPAWRTAAAPTLLSDLAMLAKLNIDILLLGLFVPAAEVGHYFAATRLASLLGLIEFAIKAGLGHRFARAAASDDPGALEAAYRAARRLSLLPGLGASLLLIVAAPYILRLFGPDFAAAAPLATLLIAATGLRLALGPADEALAMAGHPRLVWRSNGLAAVLMGGMTLLLAPSMGATGAALATLFGSLAGMGLQLHYLRRHLGLRPFARSARAP